MCHAECLYVTCSRVSKVVAHAHGAVSVCARPSSVRVRPSGYLRGLLLRGVLFFSVRKETLFETLSSELFDVVCGESCYSETLCESPCYGIRAAMVWSGRLLVLRWCYRFLSSLLFAFSLLDLMLVSLFLSTAARGPLPLSCGDTCPEFCGGQRRVSFFLRWPCTSVRRAHDRLRLL